MRRRSRWSVRAICLGLGFGLGFGLGQSEARAQAGGGAAGRSSPGVNANPYANPYLNPFLNPYMAEAAQAQGNPALYFIAAQQATGGIGSGRLGGPNSVFNSRPAGGRAAAGVGASAPRGASNVPGASASRFFNRGGQTTQSKAPVVGRYYNRQDTHFPNNGR